MVKCLRVDDIRLYIYGPLLNYAHMDFEWSVGIY